MAVENTAKRSFFKTKCGMAMLVFLCLLVIDLTMMGVSFAKYVTKSNAALSAGIASFTPVISCGESWEYTESFAITSAEGKTSFPFAVSNATGTTPVSVVVTLIVGDVLPLSFELYAGSTKLTPVSQNGNVRTYKYPMGQVDTEFSLQVAWLSGIEYDERYNGVTNDMHLVVTCEQAQVGGAP